MNNCSLMPFTEQGLPMRFGLIGCGWIVEWDHIPAMRQSGKKAAAHAV
jgi:predicted dehydrogenase